MKGSVKIQIGDEIIRERFYSNRRDRNAILEDWKDSLDDKFYLASILVVPDADDQINVHGMNCRKDEVAFELPNSFVENPVSVNV